MCAHMLCVCHASRCNRSLGQASDRKVDDKPVCCSCVHKQLLRLRTKDSCRAGAYEAVCQMHCLDERKCPALRREPELNSSSTQRSTPPSASYRARHSSVVRLCMLPSGAAPFCWCAGVLESRPDVPACSVCCCSCSAARLSWRTQAILVGRCKLRSHSHSLVGTRAEPA